MVRPRTDTRLPGVRPGGTPRAIARAEVITPRVVAAAERPSYRDDSAVARASQFGVTASSRYGSLEEEKKKRLSETQRDALRRQYRSKQDQGHGRTCQTSENVNCTSAAARDAARDATRAVHSGIDLARRPTTRRRRPAAHCRPSPHLDSMHMMTAIKKLRTGEINMFRATVDGNACDDSRRASAERRTPPDTRVVDISHRRRRRVLQARARMNALCASRAASSGGVTRRTRSSAPHRFAQAQALLTSLGTGAAMSSTQRSPRRIARSSCASRRARRC